MFKVGEYVRVRKDLVVGEWYGNFVLLDGNMKKCIGKKVKVITVSEGKSYNCYCEEEDLYFYFSPEMLESISKAKEYTLIVTDKKIIILDKGNKKRGLSICHEEDTFDFSIGVKLAWDRLHGITDETPKLQISPPEFDKCVIVDEGLTLPAWKSEAEKYGIKDFSGGGYKIDNTEVYDVVGFVINPYGKKVYIIRGKNGSRAVEEGGIKPVEYKLYDCNGVELKEGDEVKSICLVDGTFCNNTIEKNSEGILFNSGFSRTHRADRNNGRKDNSDSNWKWYVVKITK